MNIILIPCRHHTLYCKDNIILILKEIALSKQPKFIAVEYNKTLFQNHIITNANVESLERTRRDFLSNKLSQPEFDAIAESIACEGYAHKDVFPDTPTVWLDNRRELDDVDIRSAQGSLFYNKALSVINYLDNNSSENSGRELVIESEICDLETPDTTPDNPDRDGMWENELAEHLELSINEIGIVIVGSNHTRDRKGLIRQRLRSKFHGITIKSALTPPL